MKKQELNYTLGAGEIIHQVKEFDKPAWQPEFKPQDLQRGRKEHKVLLWPPYKCHDAPPPQPPYGNNKKYNL